jgi:hypothetical protein
VNLPQHRLSTKRLLQFSIQFLVLLMNESVVTDPVYSTVEGGIKLRHAKEQIAIADWARASSS